MIKNTIIYDGQGNEEHVVDEDSTVTMKINDDNEAHVKITIRISKTMPVVITICR